MMKERNALKLLGIIFNKRKKTVEKNNGEKRKREK